MDPLEVGGRRDGTLHAGAHGASDGNHLRGAVRDQTAIGLAVAAQDVQDARWQELLGQLGKHLGGGRGGVAGLEHDGVAGGRCVQAR
ncbi:hypothetical protein GCM10023323_39500 [Streptomyces thinghirensis]|uniref:Uncharacterized protein n=1 Tax=Streptomyces thinghirensis TaxID=551547 RepID=A0ABP9T497_9ACTN